MLVAVVGTGRCGSTLVQELLCRHPSVGFVSGLDDKLARLNLAGRFNGRLYRRSTPRPIGMTSLRHGRLLQRGRFRVAPSEAYQLLDRQVFAGFSRPCRDLLAGDLTPYIERRLRRFFDTRIARQDCAVLAHHITGWPRTGLLRAAYPELKVVNVVRDGRAVTNSWLQMGWWNGWQGPDSWLYGPLPPHLHTEWDESGRSFPVLAALGWKLLMEAYTEARAATPTDRWLDLRYEHLLADPRGCVDRLLGFLDLPWTPRFEAGFARYRFQLGRDAAYRDDLTPEQIAAVERVLEKPLTEWGYR